jgi:phosphate transport system ATP-binding protein
MDPTRDDRRPRAPLLAGLAAVRRAPRRHGAPKIESIGLNFYYGQTQALRDISVKLTPTWSPPFIGPSAAARAPFLRTLNRMNDIIPGRASRAGAHRRQDIYDGVDVVQLRRRVGMVFQKSNPFPKSIFENVAYGLRINKMTSSPSDLAGRVEESLKQAALWTEVKDRLHSSALAPVGRPAAAPLHRAGAGGAARHPADGRAASALDPIATQRHRGAGLRPEEGLHDRHRDA